MKTADCLEQELHTNSSAMITLITDINALLFTPMLAEVAGRFTVPDSKGRQRGVPNVFWPCLVRVLLPAFGALPGFSREKGSILNEVPPTELNPR
jgi:hypothetical protein